MTNRITWMVLALTLGLPGLSTAQGQDSDGQGSVSLQRGPDGRYILPERTGSGSRPRVTIETVPGQAPRIRIGGQDLDQVNRAASDPTLSRDFRPSEPARAVLAAATGTTPRYVKSTSFPRFRELDPNVKFWQDTFTKYTSDDIVYHDVWHLGLVYSVLNLRDITSSSMSSAAQEQAIKKRREFEGKRIVKTLERLANGSPITSEERKIAAAIRALGKPQSYAATLADRVRSQRGLGNRFCSSMERAFAYMPEMQRILRAEGVPTDLAALPLVESGYNIGAHSSVGAAGMWQFTLGTGKMYLGINSAYDDRRDPLRATAAAAKLLRNNYAKLGSWPLAITAYNHGAAGMARAVSQLGTKDLGKIYGQYKGRTFGFASRNFYAEFLAAREAVASAESLCGRLNVQPYQRDTVRMTEYVHFRDLARAAGVSSDRLQELNPALKSTVIAGRSRVPKGYQLNLPAGSANAFQRAYASLPSSSRTARVASSSSSGSTRYHRVRSGETLARIASRYRTSVGTLMRMNGIRNASRIYSGQRLKIPGASSSSSRTAVAAAPKPAAPKVTYATHRVGRGQTLSQIAAMYKTSVSNLQSLNRIRDPRRLKYGQALKVPSRGGTIVTRTATVTASHKVRTGETLWAIARKYGTSVSTLQRLNGLGGGSRVRSGQTLKVPGSSRTTTARTHRVARGQTLSQIAAMYKVSTGALQRANSIRDPRRLRSGQVLKIPM